MSLIIEEKKTCGYASILTILTSLAIFIQKYVPHNKHRQDFKRAYISQILACTGIQQYMVVSYLGENRQMGERLSLLSFRGALGFV